MPQIKFVKGRPAIDVISGANLMAALLSAEIPVASSCNGDGVCAKCRVQISTGAENVSKENEAEVFRRAQHSIPEGERLCCQVEVRGDITVDTSYW